VAAALADSGDRQQPVLLRRGNNRTHGNLKSMVSPLFLPAEIDRSGAAPSIARMKDQIFGV
jgi:hypothetical protein